MCPGGTWLLGASAAAIQSTRVGACPSHRGWGQRGAGGGVGEVAVSYAVFFWRKKRRTAHWGELSGVQTAPQCPIAAARQGCGSVRPASCT